jgi:hypothetical protein
VRDQITNAKATSDVRFCRPLPQPRSPTFDIREISEPLDFDLFNNIRHERSLGGASFDLIGRQGSDGSIDNATFLRIGTNDCQVVSRCIGGDGSGLISVEYL